MSRILRINGVITDITESVNINLSYKSPIFGDLQKLSANTSLTIKLPLTAQNRALFQNVNLLGVQHALPYDYVRVDYEEDGLIIIDNGVGYIHNIGESIDLSVVFGGLASFTNIKDAKLNEMPIPVEEGQIDWGSGMFADEASASDIMFLPFDYGQGVCTSGSSDKIEYAHPSLRVSKILSWINQAYDLKLASIGEDLIVPCVTKNRRDDYGFPIVYKETTYQVLPIAGIYYVQTSKNFTDGSFSFKILDVDDVYPAITFPNKALFRIKAKVKFGVTWIEIADIYVKFDDSDKSWYKKGVDYEDALEIDIPANKIINFGFKVPDEYKNLTIAELKYSVKLCSDHLTLSEKFDTLYNLPKIKVVDFIKGLMQLNGVFPYLTPDGIGYISVETVYENLNKAIDWSDKLTKIENVGFRFGDYAQENTITWAEDETVSEQASDKGTLVVDNRTIEKEKECIKLPFTASDDTTPNGLYGNAIIPMYTTSYDKEGVADIEFQEVKPRILMESRVGRGLIAGRFVNSMRLTGENGIVSTKYAKYQEVIKKPKTAKCEMILTAKDIASLDLTVPIYVEQLAGYYAVLSVLTKDGLSDVELLKL